MRKLVVEAIGTFFLVLTIGLVVLDPGAGDMAPLAIGAALMAMVYAGGHISGAHYNPAVTLGVWIRGMCSGREAVRYWFVQLLGATVAAGVVVQLKGDGAATTMALDFGHVFLAEALFTFALVWVVLNVATASGTEGNSYFGLAIGLTVMAGAYSVGGISGAAFNPAVAVGLALFGVMQPSSLWIFLAAQLVSAALAAVLFNVLVLSMDKPTTASVAEQRGLRPAAEPEE